MKYPKIDGVPTNKGFYFAVNKKYPTDMTILYHDGGSSFPLQMLGSNSTFEQNDKYFNNFTVYGPIEEPELK